MATSDLVSRLLEAIGETERLANGNETWWAPPDRPGTVDTGIGGMTLNVSLPSYAAHIAHNDPSSVLRRCAADRRTVEEWLKQVENPFNGLSDEPPYFIVNLFVAYGLEVTQ